MVKRSAIEAFCVRLFWLGLAVYLLVLPVEHTIALRNIGLAIMLLATVGALVAERRWPILPLPAAWLAYAAVALASLSYAVAPADSFSEVRVEVLYGLVIFAVATTWASGRELVGGIGVLLAATNALFVLAALDHVNLGSSMNVSMNLPAFAKAGVNANFIVTVLPLLAYVAWRAWNTGRRGPATALGVLIAVDLIALLISYNRQSFVALFVGTLCAGLLVLKRRFSWRRLTLFVTAMLLAAALGTASLVRREAPSKGLDEIARDSVVHDVRWALWRFSAGKILEHPLTGGGFGRGVFDKLYPEFMADNDLLWHAHNMVLNKGIQMGFPGMLVWLALWFCLAREFYRRLDGPPAEAALALTGLTLVVVVLMKNMTDDFFVRDAAQLFWLLAGVLLGSLRRPPAAVIDKP